MPKILSVNDMLDAAALANLPNYDKHREILEKAATALAMDLAKHFEIEADDADHQPGFGGLCSNFYAKAANQACPPEIDYFDKGGDWVVREEWTPGDDPSP